LRKGKEIMRKSQIMEKLRQLEMCIDVGHDFKLESHWRNNELGGVMSEWECERCGYRKICALSDKEAKIVEAYEGLKPGD